MTHALFALWASIVAGAIGLAASVAIYVPPELNLRTGPEVVWFPLPTLFIAVVVLAQVENRRAPISLVVQGRSPGVWVRVGVLVPVVAAVGLFLSGWDRVLEGSSTLIGDEKVAPPLFQAAYSLVAGIAAALVEEAAVRGLFQLRTKPVIGEGFSQFGALVIFLALHGSAVAEPKRLLFLIVVGLSSGYLASTTRAVLAPAAFHAFVNATIACTVLALRP
jgi:membrane protease YdiL (CAAX protease family)